MSSGAPPRPDADEAADSAQSPLLPAADADADAGAGADTGAAAEQQPPDGCVLDLRAFDGVRGLAALTICAGHILTFFVPVATPYADPRTWGPAGPAGPTLPDGVRWPAFGLEYLSAVTLFFCLSGFTLTAVYTTADGTTALATPAERALFRSRRVARLAPLYYGGLLWGVVPFAVYSSAADKALSAPAALLGLQSVVLVHCNSWDGPLWTVGALAMCYLAFPPLLARLRAQPPARLRAIAAGCSAACALSVRAFLGASGLSLMWVLHFCVAFRAPQFVAGVAAALLAQRRPWRRPTLVAEACSAALALNAGGCAALTAAVPPAAAGGALFTWAYSAEFLLPAVHCAWLSALATPGCGGPTRALLASRPLRALGAISYALYCTHFPTLVWASWAAAGRGVSYDALPMKAPNGLLGWFALPTAAVAPLLVSCVAVAAVAHVALERPARATLRAKAAAALADPLQRPDAAA